MFILVIVIYYSCNFHMFNVAILNLLFVLVMSRV